MCFSVENKENRPRASSAAKAALIFSKAPEKQEEEAEEEEEKAEEEAVKAGPTSNCRKASAGLPTEAAMIVD